MGKLQKRKLYPARVGSLYDRIKRKRGSLIGSEERHLVRQFKKFKLKKKKLKNRALQQKIKIEEETNENIPEGQTNDNASKPQPNGNTSKQQPVMSVIKIEVDDVLQNKDIISSYTLNNETLCILSSDDDEDDSVKENTNKEENSDHLITEMDDSNEISLIIEDESHKDLRSWSSIDGSLCLIFLHPRQIVAIKGICSMKCLHGNIEINGKSLDKGQRTFVDVVSCDGSSLLCIEDSTEVYTKLNKKIVQSLLSKIKDVETLSSSSEKSLREYFDHLEGELRSCVLIKKKDKPLLTVLKDLNDFKVPSELQVYVEPFPSPVLTTKKWKDVVDEILIKSDENKGCNCSIMVCGGKDVGKSSFARYTVNRLLNRHDSVYFLDCDCGQTEFTPPGILSLVKINEQLLGQPFSHQMKPIKSYFYGYISSKDTPNDYISLVQSLFQYYMDECDSTGPLVINLQGWIKGLGLSLLVDCIRIINPCVIIQINSTQENKNLTQDLSDNFVEQQPGWSIVDAHQSSKQRNHERFYQVIYSEVPNNPRNTKGMVSRNLSITTYLSRLFTQSNVHSGGEKWIPPSLSIIKPYAIRFSDIALHVVHEKVTRDLTLFAFNASLVCLSSVSEELIVDCPSGPRILAECPNSFEFHGLGIVRNIDPVKEILYLLTPEPLEVLEKVNVLLKGNVQLPQSFLTQDTRGQHPYCCYDYEKYVAIGSGTMKPRFNLKRKPSRMRNSFGEKT